MDGGVLPNEEDEMPIPLNSSMTPTISHINHNIVNIPAAAAYSHGKRIIIPSAADVDHHEKTRPANIKYKECMKNQAIAVGGNATDGCGEFLADGEEGTIQALSCSACHCHRNFHRKLEIAANHHQPSSENINCRYFRHEYFNPRIGRKVDDQNQEFLDRNVVLEHDQVLIHPSRPQYRMCCDQSDEQEDRPNQGVKKRFRTKFTQEQKEKMHDFAEKVGWKIQKVDESVVQSFCQQVGVKRRVLRVWMHNNKHNVAKKLLINDHDPDTN